MNEKEQIAKMVMIIDKGTQTTCALRDKDHKNCGDCEECWTYAISKILYNAEYRRTDETAQEIYTKLRAKLTYNEKIDKYIIDEKQLDEIFFAYL